MTVHAVLIKTATTPTPDLVNDVRAAHASLPEALPDQAREFDTVPSTPEEVAPEHEAGLYRYAESEAKATILDDLEGAIPAVTAWYGLWHHACEHDLPGDMRSGCPDWSVERASGSVPTEVRP